MDETMRLAAIERLSAGEELPADWVTELFPPERRETELVYWGKQREEDVIASTMAVPLQPIASFGDPASEWSNRLIFGENLQVLRRLLEMKRAGELVNADGSLGFRLVYIDPPFATKRDFQGVRAETAYQDRLAGAQFLEYLRRRLILIRELLADDGSVYVHLDSRRVHYVKVLMDEVFGEQNFRNEIVWQRTNARSTVDRWPRLHDTLLYYVRSQSAPFAPLTITANAAKMPHTLITGPDGLKYQTYELTGPGITANGESGRSWRGFDPSKMGRHWAGSRAVMDALDAEGLIHWPRRGGFPRRRDAIPFDPMSRTVTVGDVWTDIDRINQSAKERSGYPTQKPEALIERVLLGSTQPGDLVGDFFAGSGTTAVVAERNGRRWVSVDSGKLAIYTCQKRLLAMSRDNQGGVCTPRFTLLAAGLYNFTTLSDLPWEDWRYFALQLFGCTDEVHKIGGVQFDGRMRGSSVLVFNHHERPEQTIDEHTIASLHSALRDKVGARVFVIAPRGVFDFQQDYVQMDNTRYYALRIPYSVIQELHRQGFKALVQPSSSTALKNTFVDAVGFDFIEPPDVTWAVGTLSPEEGELPFVHVIGFDSHARVTGGGATDIGALSMLMIDVDYDGSVFDLDEVWYANDLAERDWTAQIKACPLGERVMLVFVDIYGNESRVVVPRSDFLVGAGADVNDD